MPELQTEMNNEYRRERAGKEGMGPQRDRLRGVLWEQHKPKRGGGEELSWKIEASISNSSHFKTFPRFAYSC